MPGLDPNLPDLRFSIKRSNPDEGSEPDFDFCRKIGRKLVSTSGARSVVLLFVDAADFDVLFFRKVARLVLNTTDENSGNVPRVVLVVCTRAHEGGANKVTSVHLVSAVRGWLAGARGNVWVVGAQNAGKSTLINSTAKHVSGGEVNELTEAPVPVTTLGILRVEGFEIQKLVQVSKELKPRTYIIKSHIDSTIREKIQDSTFSSAVMYVWLSCQYSRICAKPLEFHLSGKSGDVSSIDVSASGVGCFSMGLKGDACLNYGPQSSNHFEVSRIAVSKIVKRIELQINSLTAKSRGNGADTASSC
ncbi:hypothetical protein MKX03_010322 [Papaver bracteatum]|nr:hypothetical protein MKX03_010322 [Papaver bracteatum]